jgi:myo-inositol 2-dehydrogenase / D-chiro-inositol 1-dehydrogenase
MTTRRRFLHTAAVAGFPTIVPASVFGQNAPSNKIQVGQLGCGRIARVSELPGVLKHHETARFVAVCDIDTIRLADGKELVDAYYSRVLGPNAASSVKTYRDYHEMLADKSIDAICISTPDHWHAQPAMEAALAGKDIYLQKPASLTIAEGRQMADTIARTGRILQLGSQQRSDVAFRLACEVVRNGRIGAVREIFIGLPYDPAGGSTQAMPVPSNLDYNAWLGSTPVVPYTEERVHPQSPDLKVRYDRPGWLRCEQFGAGMITGWGTHHYDIAHWAMGLQNSGPVEVVADAQFPKSGLWDVHGSFLIRAKYPNGAVMYVSDKFPNGIKFIGDDGWVWVTRGRYNAAEVASGKHSTTLDASDLRILTAPFKETDVRLHVSPKNDHHLDWLTSVKTRLPNVAPAEEGHRSCTACLVSHVAMKTGTELKWDPKTERFTNDEKANAMLSRSQRAPYGSNNLATAKPTN